jgi:hypothetical protein
MFAMPSRTESAFRSQAHCFRSAGQLVIRVSGSVMDCGRTVFTTRTSCRRRKRRRVRWRVPRPIAKRRAGTLTSDPHHHFHPPIHAPSRNGKDHNDIHLKNPSWLVAHIRFHPIGAPHLPGFGRCGSFPYPRRMPWGKLGKTRGQTGRSPISKSVGVARPIAKRRAGTLTSDPHHHFHPPIHAPSRNGKNHNDIHLKNPS